jgi:hypothetical protein
MERCAAMKANGLPCATRAMKASQWCFNHSPDYSEERRPNASKGGRAGGKGQPGAGDEVSWLKQTLKDVVDGVLTGNIEQVRVVIDEMAAEDALGPYSGEQRDP